MTSQQYDLNTRLGKFETYIINLKMCANYQPIVLRYLVNFKEATKDHLVHTLEANNKFTRLDLEDKKRIQYFKTVPVYKVLLNHNEKFVKQNSKGNFYLDLDLSTKDKEYFEKILTSKVRQINERLNK